MSTVTDKRNIFPFFDLPRELRDMIYGFTLCEKRITRSPQLLMRPTAIASRHLMVVSHHFSAEIREQVQKKAHLHVARAYGIGPIDHLTNVIPRGEDIRALTVSINLGGGMSRLPSHRACITSIVRRLPALEELNVCLGVVCARSDYDHHGWCRKVNGEDWTNLRSLTSLKVFDSTTRGVSYRSGKNPWDCAIMQWDPATGRVGDIDQIRRKLLSIVESFLRLERLYSFHLMDDTKSQDYNTFVEDSMDLDTLRYLMIDGEYCAVEGFITAVLRIVRNVKNFEPLAELYSAEADELEAELWRRIRQVPEWAHISREDFKSTAKKEQAEG